MWIKYLKAYIKGISIEEQLRFERERLESLLAKEPEYNTLRIIRDLYGFGKLKRTVIMYSICSVASLASFHYGMSINFVIGLLTTPAFLAVIGLIMLYKYPVTIEYWLD